MIDRRGVESAYSISKVKWDEFIQKATTAWDAPLGMALLGLMTHNVSPEAQSGMNPMLIEGAKEAVRGATVPTEEEKGGRVPWI